MKSFLAKFVVTLSLPWTLFLISLSTLLLWSFGYQLLDENQRLTEDNITTLHLNTAKFCMWFLLGYGGIQAFGMKFELDKLKQLEDKTYKAHAQAEFDTWSDFERTENDKGALEILSKIDNQRIRIKGDERNAKVLWIMGVVLFFSVSVCEVIYPAIK